MAFVPMFSKKYQAGEDAEKFAQEAFAFLASLLIGLTLIAQLAMPWLVLAMASGFAGDERFDLAVVFGRICFPYILLISLSALFSGVLNSMGRFAMAAAAPVFLNIILVAAMTVAYLLGWDVAMALVWGVPLAGAVQLALVARLEETRAGFDHLVDLCLAQSTEVTGGIAHAHHSDLFFATSAAARTLG